jgi:hypothetical protein
VIWPPSYKGGGEFFEDVDEQKGFRGGQPQIEIRQIWRNFITPFPL